MTDAATAVPPAGSAPAAAATGSDSAVPIAEPPSERLLSLDVFRGVTIAGMLLVNNPGTWSAIYGPLRHAPWHGWTPTDLIFPFFLFIVGVAMTFSFGKQLARGESRSGLLLKATKRAFVLFGLGLVLHGFPDYDLSTIRIPGVLQRIALAYLIATPIVLWTAWRGQALWAAALMLVYWALMTLVPVPGVGAGVLEAGQDLGAYIDRMIFGTEHLWSQSRTWDPEGLLSTVPAVATVLLGVLAGHWIRSGRSMNEKAVGLFVAGNAGLLLGIIWNYVFPINKPIWTSSYVVFTAGMALHFLAVCYWLVDVKGWKRWTLPFVVYGTNAIAAYFLSSLVARIIGLSSIVSVGTTPAGDPIAVKTWVFENLYLPLLSPINASLAFGLTYVAVWCAIMWVFYRRRVFIKV